MEPLACSLGFETDDVDYYGPRKLGKGALKPLTTEERTGDSRHGGAGVMWKVFGRKPDTQIRSRPKARAWATEFAMIYELSRGLHREASWRADRFGPIRISPLQ